MYNNFFFGNHGVYEIMWKYIVQPFNPQRITYAIWPTRMACWIFKATNTHSDYVIIIAVQLQICLHERTSLLCEKTRKRENKTGSVRYFLCRFLSS